MDDLLLRLSREQIRKALADALNKLAFVKDTVRDMPEASIPYQRLNEIAFFENNIKQYRDELERRRSADSPARIFYSYSRHDLMLLMELDKALAELKERQIIKIFWDVEMDAGREWHPKTTEELSEADIILILVSPNFLGSRYCNQVELPKAIELHNNGLSQVIPIILSECKWKETELGRLQAIPRGGIPVTSLSDKSAAWEEVVASIKPAIQAVRGEVIDKRDF